jgi:hypothetical protein
MSFSGEAPRNSPRAHWLGTDLEPMRDENDFQSLCRCSGRRGAYARRNLRKLGANHEWFDQRHGHEFRAKF